MSGFLKVLAIVLLSFAMADGRALLGHDSLYHYVEVVMPREAAGAEISFSVHAADLAVARSLGADPAGKDLEWLRGRDEAAIEALLVEARAFVATTFALVVGGREVDLAGRSLRFPEAARLKEDPSAPEAARPGFLVGSLLLEPGASEVELRHAPGSGKRLLLVLNRPGAFPLVKDLAPGERATLSLDPSRP